MFNAAPAARAAHQPHRRPPESRGRFPEAGIPYATLQRHHLALLERTFLVRQIDAWPTNLGARVLKAAKLFLVDSGLAAARAP